MADETTAPLNPSALTMIELLDRIQRSDDSALYECLAADVHSVILGLSRLTTRKHVEGRDIRHMFERFRLTLAVPAAEGSPDTYGASGKGLNAVRNALGVAAPNGRSASPPGFAP